MSKLTGPLFRYLERQKDKRDFAKHREVADAARARGADFDCAQAMGFAATDSPPTVPHLCAKCRTKGLAT